MKYLVTIPYESIDRVEIYINNKKKALSTIKKETKCDYIMNGGFFTLSSWTPVCHLRSNNVTYASDKWNYFGYGWNANDIPKIMQSKDKESVANYICCVELINNGKITSPLTYPADVGGSRQRTAMGLTKNNDLVIFCSDSNNPYTPENLRDYLYTNACVSAIMLDGGASSQCDFSGNKIVGSRKVQNLILIYTKKSDKKYCPYQEPVTNIRYGSRGIGAKWVQWHLNYYGASLNVDGIFGLKSVTALRKYQKNNGLVVDGICGPATRNKLKGE